MPIDVTQIAAICTAIFTGIFAGIAIHNQRAKLRFKLMGYAKQLVRDRMRILGAELDGMDYFAVVEKKGSGIAVGCYATVVFKEKQYSSYLHDIVRDSIDTSGHEEEGRVAKFAAAPLFAVGPIGMNGLSISSLNQSPEEYEAAKHQKMEFTLSSNNAAGLSEKVSLAKVIAEARESPLVGKGTMKREVS